MSIKVQFNPQNKRYQLIDGRHRSLKEANDFLRSIEVRGLSPCTLRAYAFDLATIYRWVAKTQRTIDTLDGPQLIDFVATQREDGAKPRSINRRLITLGMFYRFCTGKELGRAGLTTPGAYFRSPGRDRELGLHILPRRERRYFQVTVPKTVVEPLTTQQVRAFLKTIRRYRDLAIVYLMLLCGLRSREVLCLCIHDIIFDDCHLRVTGKGCKERLLPAPQTLLVTFRDYLRLERPENTATDRLFVILQGKNHGQPMTSDGLRSLFRHRRRRHQQIACANAHRFRHTFGADMAREGVRLPILQKMMGHADPTTTLQYINLSLEDIAQEYFRALERIRGRYND